MQTPTAPYKIAQLAGRKCQPRRTQTPTSLHANAHLAARSSTLPCAKPTSPDHLAMPNALRAACNCPPRRANMSTWAYANAHRDVREHPPRRTQMATAPYANAYRAARKRLPRCMPHLTARSYSYRCTPTHTWPHASRCTQMPTLLLESELENASVQACHILSACQPDQPGIQFLLLICCVLTGGSWVDLDECSAIVKAPCSAEMLIW